MSGLSNAYIHDQKCGIVVWNMGTNMSLVKLLTVQYSKEHRLFVRAIQPHTSQYSQAYNTV